jgi:hypothetical protein
MRAAPRPVFDSYSLPLPRRREGPAAALSFIVHITIAILVLWRGAALFEGGGSGSGPRGGGGGGGRPAVSWFAMPAVASPQAQDVPPPHTAPAVTVPTIAVPLPEPVKIEVPLPSVVIAPPPPAAIGTGAGTSGGVGAGPGSDGGKGTGTGTGVGADSGAGSGGNAGDIFPANVYGLIVPPDCVRGEITVRFWVERDGRVSQVVVNPPPKNAGCHRELIKHMMGYSFRPAMTRAGVPVASVYQIRLIH